jgi:divalent metal cation (Fe/Co/Zn/Cd) transporter
MVRKKPSKRFSYGNGRVEDLAGTVIVCIMLISGLMVAYPLQPRLARSEHNL